MNNLIPHGLFFLFLAYFGTLQAQPVRILRYAGDNFLEGNSYRLDLFNEGSQTQDLSGYLLVSRQYAALFPKGTRLLPQSSMTLGKGLPGLTLPFEAIEDFIIRIPSGKEKGDYVVLFDPKRNLIDAFYFGPRPQVGFLPDQGVLITFQNKQIPFEVPGEEDPAWSYLPVSPDPAMAFARIGGSWRAVSRTKNTLPATDYGEVDARYEQGIVTLQGESIFERDCIAHLVERSSDGRNFSIIGRVPAQGNTSQRVSYRFYDDQVKPNRRYYYRIKNVDRFGFTVYSALVEIYTDEIPEDFSMEVFLGRQGSGATLNIRFSTREPRPVRIKLLDEQFRERALLFSDALDANGQYLIQYTDPLPLGRYFVVADTPQRRFFEELIVK